MQILPTHSLLDRTLAFCYHQLAMTDIRQHLPTILSSIRQYLTGPDAPETIRAHLREWLPASYGVGAGCLVSEQGERSQPCDIIVYDTTVLPLRPLTDPLLFERRQALAVIILAQQPEVPALRDLLCTIASAKILQPALSDSEHPSSRPLHGKNHVQKKLPSLKKLLPLGIVAFERLITPTGDHIETLDALLKEHAEHLRPDYLLAQSHQIFYSHPALTGATFVESTINIAREPALKKPHPCYVCKKPFAFTHFFYQHLCLSCGDLNYSKRSIPADLTGRIALVTGARVKIGYATALRLLRAGAQVIVTTRFPHDAAQRYNSEPDFADWQDRLHIYGLDFRYLSVLERFVEHLRMTYPALDIVVNNAAQTIRHSPDYYAPLLPCEQATLHSLPAAQQDLVRRSHEVLPPTPFAIANSVLPFLPGDHSLPALPSTSLGHANSPDAVLPAFSENGSPDKEKGLDLPINLNAQNSWTLPFDQIDLTEFLEVQTINVTAPFLLISHLHPLLCRSSFAQRFIINVSAVEGQFASTKQGKHVHTNMAKAALNMLTHTTAARLALDGIFLNSVDPGWISQQVPRVDAYQWEQLQKLLPLDLIDAAARVCDPIFQSIATGEAPSGYFYKDYHLTAW